MPIREFVCVSCGLSDESVLSMMARPKSLRCKCGGLLKQKEFAGEESKGAAVSQEEMQVLLAPLLNYLEEKLV
jgi:hypothetical protein